MDNENRTEWEQVYREVETLQRMKHRNIIPLLASYYLDTTDSSERPLRTLYLLFPWADMDLETWMNSPQVPTPIQTLSRRERRAYIYRSTSALVSGLSYLHREIGGLITSHHDLKPSNVLVVGQDFKIADLGRSHLRPLDGGSETEGANGLGTYEYQPPEYWQNNGSRAKVKHGRAFDIWAMGCMLIELATLIVHDWESGMLLNFRRERAENRSRDRPQLAESRKHEDSSFHNNWSVVENWIIGLRRHAAGSEMLEDTLDVAQEMLAQDPRSRLYSWEAEIDLHKIQNPDHVQLGYVGQGSLCVKPPWEVHHQGNVPNGAQTPLHRAALKEDKTRLMDLLRLGWPIFVQDQNGNTSLDIVKRSADKYFRESFSLYFGQGIAATRKNDGFSLIEAAETGNIAMATRLLEKGISPLLVNSEGHSALFLAVVQGHNSVISRLLELKIQEQLFLKDKVTGNTVLHEAATLGHENTVKQLLLYSPVLEDRQHEGKTALFLATESDHEKTIEVLLDHVPKVQVFTQSNTGDTPVHKAAILGHKALELLLSSEDSSRCLEHKNQLGETPVWLALRHKNLEGFRRLKERGASLAVANNNQENLLHIVAREELGDFLNQNIHAFDASKIEERDRWNDTPLTIAERMGYSDIASLLKSYYLGKIKPNEVENLGANNAGSSPPRLFYTLGSESKWMKDESEGYWRHLTYESYKVYEQIYTSAAKGRKSVQCKPKQPLFLLLLFSRPEKKRPPPLLREATRTKREKQANCVQNTNQVVDFVKQFNSHDPRPETVECIWKRLLASPTTDVRATSYPKAFVLAVLYMLHLERFSSERPRGDSGRAGEVKAKRREILKRFDVWVPCGCRGKECRNEWNFADDRGIFRSLSLSPGDGLSSCNIARLVEWNARPEYFGSREAKHYKVWSAMLEGWKKHRV